MTPLLNILATFNTDLKYSRIYNLTGSSAALLFALFDEPFLAVELTDELAEELYKDIIFFREILKKEQILFLPEINGPALSGERAKLVYSLNENVSLVCSFKNLESIIWSREEINKKVISIKKGIEISRTEIEERLKEIGYKNVSLVSEKGEYSRRGWLFDIFPSTSDTPIRIEFFGDEIDNIKIFDVDTQKSTEDLTQLLIFPAEDPLSGSTIFELMDHAKYIFSDSIRERAGLRRDIIFFSKYSIKGPGYDAGVLPIKGLGILPEERKKLGELPQRIKHLQRDNRIVIVSSSEGQAERLKSILSDGNVVAPGIASTDILDYKGSVSITVGELSSGLFFPGILILTEKEIFGERPGYRPIKKSKVSKLLTLLDDLRPGDFVVHREHGIGRFNRLTRQNIEGFEEDLMMIDYEGGRLYIPLQNVNKIQKYHSEEGFVPKIDRLGGKTWQRTREKARKKILDMAEKLIALYAEREVYKGFSFSPDTELHAEFDSFFSYEETADQIKAVEDIKRDMESEKPMDRLICGDVGYGKTEVAIKAAFKAAYDGRQVALLVPTTILCEQHYRTFKTRFSAFPIRTDYLSRFKSREAQKETVKALSNGDIDIIIGTHSLLGKDIIFYNLGLLIIDEEHRFGVRQKEKIKELKKGVDVLTLSATPIPRTFSMALSDIRDMSTIETPPEERLSVKSVVSIFDEELIKKVIIKELERNGQVFFVNNRIKDIYNIADYLARLLPSAKIAVAHGQMAEKELETAMLEFYERKIDILVSTAIIGSGLDIPTANTIIINRADMMGLADLYQLRGRVGRGNIRAYSYFLIPGEDIITEEAKMRLQAIQEMSYLGAGFRLALKDLEIRGAGNLLGAEQSGHIHAVGFDLYMEMLEKAVAELKGIKIEEEFEPSISLRVNAFIPEEYIDDITLRLSIYRRIASSKTLEDIKALELEIEDRFGKIPDAAKHILDVMRLKILAKKLFVTKIQDIFGSIRVTFSHDTKVLPQDIFDLQKKRDGKIKFLPDGFEINMGRSVWENVYEEIFYLFTCLTNSDNFNEEI
ncbi:MAG: transcription-repair coupling factor [Nitrospirae bacterium RBG_13_39_12]|nr:MAG: transcription-repair coupling factor [Nitrospirae bacterium RBG_13_39_12]